MLLRQCCLLCIHALKFVLSKEMNYFRMFLRSTKTFHVHNVTGKLINISVCSFAVINYAWLRVIDMNKFVITKGSGFVLIANMLHLHTNTVLVIITIKKQTYKATDSHYYFLLTLNENSCGIFPRNVLVCGVLLNF